MKLRQAKKIVRQVCLSDRQESCVSYKTFKAAQKRFNRLPLEVKQKHLDLIKEVS